MSRTRPLFHPAPRPAWQRWGLRLAALAALAAVFATYLDPHLMVDLANRVWSCF